MKKFFTIWLLCIILYFLTGCNAQELRSLNNQVETLTAELRKCKNESTVVVHEQLKCLVTQCLCSCK